MGLDRIQVSADNVTSTLRASAAMSFNLRGIWVEITFSPTRELRLLRKSASMPAKERPKPNFRKCSWRSPKRSGSRGSFGLIQQARAYQTIRPRFWRGLSLSGRLTALVASHEGYQADDEIILICNCHFQH
jgi:hypothetical protein